MIISPRSQICGNIAIKRAALAMSIFKAKNSFQEWDFPYNWKYWYQTTYYERRVMVAHKRPCSLANWCDFPNWQSLIHREW